MLALNVGSSSLKAAVRDPALRLQVHVSGLDGPRARMEVSEDGCAVERAVGGGGWSEALRALRNAVADRALEPDAVAHRVVHGSALLARASRADDALLSSLRAEQAHDPLHLPRQLDVVDLGRELWPAAEVVLCSDSAFHAGLSDEATTLPLPAASRALGLRRWGFHGLALQSVVDAQPDLGSAVVAHLGSGCSVSAVADGRSRATTMGLSPAGGVPSVTRSGDLDPEVVLRLVEEHGSVAAVRGLLNGDSGLRGMAGGGRDVPGMIAAEDDTVDLALRVWVRAVAMAVAAAVTTLDRWDALVFTGGIGVGSAEIREGVCARLLPIRPGADRAPGVPSARLAATGLRVLSLPVDEEGVLDRMARAVLAGYR